MSIYAAVPVIAFIINAFVSIYIFAQKRNSRIIKAYVYYSINISLWILCEIILRQNIPVEYIPIVFKIASISWLSIGFWFLNFTYEFIDRRKDWLYKILAVLVTAAIVVSIITDLVSDGYILYYWGPDENIGPLFIPFIMGLITLPGIYSLYLIARKSAFPTSLRFKKAAALIIYGSSVSLVVALLTNVFLPHFWGFENIFQFAESISVIQSILIFIAVYKYRLFGLGIRDISYNLFRTISEAVIITDSADKIVHINESAQNLFGISYKAAIYQDVSILITDFNDINDDEPKEKEVEINEKQKFISVSRSSVVQTGEPIGCMYFIQDITKRKITERKLIESEATFSELFESASDALVLVNTEGKIVQVNRQVEKIFGYNKFELIGESINKLIPQRFREVHVEHVADYQLKPKTREMGVNLELYGLKKDGTEFSVDVMLSPITKFNKSFTLSTIRDITERKNNERKLQESEKQYKNVVETLPHGIVETDLTGTIILANEAYSAIHGFTLEEMIGTKIWEQQTNEKDIIYLKTFAERAKEGNLKPKTEFAKRKTKNGSMIDVQIDWNYKRDAEGNIIGFISIVTDITERKRTERNLRKKRLMLSQAEQLAHLGSWEWDMTADKLVWSDELYRIFGLNKKDFQPTFEKFKTLLHPDNKEKTLTTVENSIKTGRPFFHFEKIIRPNGEVRTLSTRGIVQTNSKGETVGMYGSCLDVTEFKKIESNLLKSQKQLRALSANLHETREEERTRIAREIHDELGQVLTAINMDVGLMIDDLENEEEITTKTFLSNLKSIEELIEKLIKSVQDISTELRPDILDHLGLIPALEWHLQEFERRFKVETVLEKSIDELELPDDKKVGIFRIFQEALTNVARHSKATKVKAVLSKTENHFEMKVIDNGIGISQESMENVKSIGLIGIKERVYLLGGKISIKNTEEGGAAVHLTVPIN